MNGKAISNLNVKVDPEWRDFWRNSFEAVIPGYHQSKDIGIQSFWTAPYRMRIKRMIAESYDSGNRTALPGESTRPSEIPKVMWQPMEGSRSLQVIREWQEAVGNALHKNPDPEHIPCFRVVNAKGELSGEFAFGGAGARKSC